MRDVVGQKLRTIIPTQQAIRHHLVSQAHHWDVQIFPTHPHNVVTRQVKSLMPGIVRAVPVLHGADDLDARQAQLVHAEQRPHPFRFTGSESCDRKLCQHAIGRPRATLVGLDIEIVDLYGHSLQSMSSATGECPAETGVVQAAVYLPKCRGKSGW